MKIISIGDLVTDFYYKNGAGIMNYYKGFKWDKNKGLIGIENCDPITFDELIGNDIKKKKQDIPPKLNKKKLL